MSRQVVEHDVHGQSARHVGVDLFEEPQHVGAGVAFATDRSGPRRWRFSLRRTSRSCRCVCSHGSRFGTTRLHRQRRLRAVQRLTLGLFVEAKHHCPRRRNQIQPNEIDELLLKAWVSADFERLDLPRLEVVVGPNLGNGVLADPDAVGQRPCAPVRRPVGGTLSMGQPQHFLDGARWYARLEPAAFAIRPTAPIPRSANRERQRRTVSESTPQRRTISSLATPSLAHNSPRTCATCRCGNDVEAAIRSNSTR